MSSFYRGVLILKKDLTRVEQISEFIITSMNMANQKSEKEKNINILEK
jgi:hypothetical protein